MVSYPEFNLFVENVQKTCFAFTNTRISRSLNKNNHAWMNSITSIKLSQRSVTIFFILFKIFLDFFGFV